MSKVKGFFKDWNYCKHVKFVGAVYLTMFAIDMTLGYVIAKKALDSIDSQELDSFED